MERARCALYFQTRIKGFLATVLKLCYPDELGMSAAHVSLPAAAKRCCQRATAQACIGSREPPLWRRGNGMQFSLLACNVR